MMKMCKNVKSKSCIMKTDDKRNQAYYIEYVLLKSFLIRFLFSHWTEALRYVQIFVNILHYLKLISMPRLCSFFVVLVKICDFTYGVVDFPSKQLDTVLSLLSLSLSNTLSQKRNFNKLTIYTTLFPSLQGGQKKRLIKSQNSK